jgi:hypothetical protein
MKKWIYTGSALLIFQIILAGFLLSNERNFATFTPQANLLHFSPDAVDTILITTAGGEKVTLSRVKGTSWRLPEAFNAPADTDKVEGLLRRLADLKQGLAVATTKGAAKRFKVSDDNFERHVILKKGDEVVADFYLGTSPSFKKVHARVHDRLEVVSIPLSTYELEAEADPWVDRDLARTEKEKINSLSMADIELTRQDKSWHLAGLAADEELKTEEVEKLLADVGGLTVQGVLDPAAYSDLFQEKPALTLNLTLADGSKVTDIFVKPEKEHYYVMKRPGYDFSLKVNSVAVDEIRKIARNSLVADKGTAEVRDRAGQGVLAGH